MRPNASGQVIAQRPAPGGLRLAKRALLEGRELSASVVGPELARSWQRSLRAGLQPAGRMPGAPHASGPQLARALELQRELVAHARPVMEFLAEQTDGTESMVILAGTDGVVLQALGDLQFVSRAERVALRPGATWSEQVRGTNAIGTALAEGQAIVVHSEEHYLERNAFLTCAAAPILAPGGQLLGVLDVSGDHRGYHPHTIGLVRSAARMIEHRLFETRHDARHWPGLVLRLHAQPEGIGTLAEGLLAVREDGALAGANRAALAMLGLDWPRLARCRVEDVLAEPVPLLMDWVRRSPSVPRIVHVHGGAALWVRMEAGRPIAASRGAAPVSTVEEAAAVDALAALDTGDLALRATLQRARKLAPSAIPLLVQGESGAGKEVLARAMHASSPRRGHAFVAVNCAALPEALIEAELFGYERGAFTGAAREGATGRIREAHGGTLFLDEIGDMPLALQTRLLRVLQDRQVTPLGGGKAVGVDFWLICATHRDLRAQIEAGRFREDLFYRLNGFTLKVPALRARSDLEALLATQLAQLLPGREVQVEDTLLAALRAYAWPGNLRQLASTLRTACALLDAQESVIGWHHLCDDLAEQLRPQEPTDSAGAQPEDLRSISRDAIRRALDDAGGNVSEAARRLGISRNTLYRRIGETSA
ncbi:sigma-54-dependent Fis family transcriptional regulator [Ramlibacter alkalitolerans]|uniref:Sigma-54-dependent Fis family transcriptional regulator n=1 Tax=Ramlibacter alkalitolerans TaxID=2039631 RepID=A0ABS1JTP6_9BURK|nr:sigma-54-dependent Fis family transcriptional regulator [Ramlibacter alkalitolerans]MBL0427623.1 sigma-54-dependent Fis family transcriptional regulator [Ramlibacter alkalitolerans]